MNPLLNFPLHSMQVTYFHEESSASDSKLGMDVDRLCLDQLYVNIKTIFGNISFYEMVS